MPLQFLRHYLLAVQFFTRIPVTGALAQWVGFSPAMLRASAAHLPGVGWLVGAVVALASVLLLQALPPGGYAPLVVAALGTALGVLITGAFHEDGLADVADGLGGSHQRERALEIMKDSRVGAFGAIGIAMVLLIKVALVALLASRGPALLFAALFLGHVASRTWPLLSMRLLPHVGEASASKSRPMAEQISDAAVLVGLLWCVLGVALTLALPAAPGGPSATGWVGALALAALVWGGTVRWFRSRLGGFTGDCLGATQQLTELAFYLGLAMGLPALA